MKALLLGVLLSALIGFSAYKKKALSLSGFTAAVVLGTVIYLCGGLLFWLTMIAFFISSSLLTFIKSNKKEAAQQFNEKGVSATLYRSLPTVPRAWLQQSSSGFIRILFSLSFMLPPLLPPMRIPGPRRLAF